MATPKLTAPGQDLCPWVGFTVSAADRHILAQRVPALLRLWRTWVLAGLARMEHGAFAGEKS